MKWALHVVTFGLLASIVSAAPIVSFSSPDDLSNLIVGQPVTINVLLSNLTAGDELQYLASTVNYDGAALGAPTSITAGAIVPNPLNDPLDFVTAAAYGLADGNFLTTGTTSASHITSNGTFFTFHLTAQAAGAGQVSFSFVDALKYNPGNPSQPIDPGLTAGAALPFSITVPEPVVPASLAIAAALGLLRRRHKAITHAGFGQ